MDIQAAGINSYYIYQSALEQGSDLTSAPPDSGSGSRTQDTQVNQAHPLPDDEEQIDSASQTQEDEAAQKDGQPSASDEESMLTPDEKLLVEKLKKVDSEVRAHEMAHINRMDDFWIFIQSIIQIIYFFHPERVSHNFQPSSP